MKTTNKDFQLFKYECNSWLERLKLDDFEVNYWHENPGKYNADASCSPDYKYRRVDIRFSVDNFDETVFNTGYIKSVAKHEILHLLVGEMKDLAQDRYIIQDEIIKADERLIRKLEKLL